MQRYEKVSIACKRLIQRIPLYSLLESKEAVLTPIFAECGACADRPHVRARAARV